MHHPSPAHQIESQELILSVCNQFILDQNVVECGKSISQSKGNLASSICQTLLLLGRK